MRRRNYSRIVTIGIAFLAASTCAIAQQETVLHSFSGTGIGGSHPEAGLILDASGNLYGTTYESGAYGYGNVFELSPKAGGGWTEKILHSFGFNNGDGINPQTGVVMDAAGNLYGTTRGGGTYGYGIVYQLRRKAGNWSENILHSFNNNCQDGWNPDGGLALDASGNLYGATYSGGGYCFFGTVFKLAHAAGGDWEETILHSFDGYSSDGYYPSGVTVDRAGSVYGTTQNGGSYNYGTVFKLAAAVRAGWAETILHNFNADGTDGTNPYASPIFDGAGNLYGTTYSGGANNVGTVFELTPETDGTWNESTIHTFDQNGTDGAFPRAGLAFDGLGNLYGTTTSGGAGTSFGTVFELTPVSGGEWTENLLVSFRALGPNYPIGSLAVDASGDLYGTTADGGSNTYGTVFEIKP
jgi:uncharacterized repeat protein (TIGR03803 family)